MSFQALPIYGAPSATSAASCGPLDASKGFCNRPLKEKLAGKSLAHFGGFFKKSWRANDILWGRLDTLCQLVECTLTRARLERILWKDYLREKIRGRFFLAGGAPHPDMDLRRLFPHGGDQTLAEIVQWLQQLLDANPQVRAAALAQLESKRDLLIEAAHLEILHQEVPTVISDTVEEQAKWNQFRVYPQDRKPLSAKKIAKEIQRFQYRDPNDPDGADLELCTALASWTGGNEALMEEYFKSSALFDQERRNVIRAGGTETYGQRLLAFQALIPH